MLRPFLGRIFQFLQLCNSKKVARVGLPAPEGVGRDCITKAALTDLLVKAPSLPLLFVCRHESLPEADERGEAESKEPPVEPAGVLSAPVAGGGGGEQWTIFSTPPSASDGRNEPRHGFKAGCRFVRS